MKKTVEKIKKIKNNILEIKYFGISPSNALNTFINKNFGKRFHKAKNVDLNTLKVDIIKNYSTPTQPYLVKLRMMVGDKFIEINQRGRDLYALIRTLLKKSNYLVSRYKYYT